MNSVTNIETPQEINNKQPSNEITVMEVLKDIQTFFSSKSHEIGVDINNFKEGIDSQLTLLLKDLLSSIKNAKKPEEAVTQFVSKKINETVFQIVKENIDSVYVLDNPLDFYIVLKDNAAKYKSHFYNFLVDYEATDLNNQFPIDFQFISKALVKSHKEFKKVKL